MLQHYSDRNWDEVKKRVPWLQIVIWVFFVGVSWAKLESMSQLLKEAESTYARKDVQNLELRLLAEKIDAQTERIRLMEQQIHRLRLDLLAEKGR